MKSQECQTVLREKQAEAISNDCIKLARSCASLFRDYYEDSEQLTKKDEECVALLIIVKENIGFFNEKSKRKVGLLEKELKAIEDDNEKRVQKKKELDQFRERHKELSEEKQTLEKQKTGKDAEVKKLLADENAAQIAVNQATNQYEFVRTSQQSSNPCWDTNSPHFRNQCIDERKNKMNEKQREKDQITQQKQQAESELNSIKSDIQIKINEINSIQPSISSITQELNSLSQADTSLKQNELDQAELYSSSVQRLSDMVSLEEVSSVLGQITVDVIAEL